MKNHFLIFVYVLLFFYACSEDLEPTPPDFISAELFYNNPENYEAGLNGVYDALQSSGLSGRFPILLDAVSDNGIAQFVSVDDFLNFGNGKITSSVNNVIESAYKSPYVLIQRANSLLQAMRMRKDKNIPNEAFDNIEAQARVLRAFAYQRLLYLFGGVPLYTNPISIEESINIPRASRTELVNFVIKELKEAASTLETVPYRGQSSRITKQGALALLAETMVYEARLGNQTWKAALEVTKQAVQVAETSGALLLTDGNGRDGLANFNAVFSERKEDNKELLFWVKYDYNLDKGSNIQSNFSVVAGTLYMSAHANLEEDFYTVEGLSIDDPNAIYDSEDPYKGRDPRLRATLVVPGDKYSDGKKLKVFKGQNSNSNLLTDFAIRKFTSLNSGVALNRGGLDMPILRYSELLLLYAEVENEVHGPTASAYESINRIRARVHVGPVPMGLTKKQFQQEVIHERRVELAFEGKRWIDLVTLGIADEVINGINEGLGRVFVKNKQELFPIPLTEINRNSKLNQNPGY
jgi:hypothetical protein